VRILVLLRLALLAAAVVLPGAVSAEAVPYGLSETVLTVEASADGVGELEVTVYRPRGDGPFPLMIVNHGRAPAPASTQPRYRPQHVAYEFVRRGYAVVVPMRQGFSRSGGVDRVASCDPVADARHQARSVRRAVHWAAQQPWADAQRVVVMGQSHGGLAALAYGEDPLPGTRLIVNFAGGVREPGCEAWQSGLVEAFGELGKAAQLPSLWFYGDNDSHFPPEVWRAAYQRHTAAGARATLEAYGRFGDDAHRLFGAREGLRIWLPPLAARLAELGLPARVDPGLDPMPDLPAGPPLRKVEAGDADRLPIRSVSAREAFLDWLRIEEPKAFVISEDRRHWASAWGPVRPAGRAIERCERLAATRCRIYAVDDALVWPLGSGGN
jgi:dienelactone hydrolase